MKMLTPQPRSSAEDGCLLAQAWPERALTAIGFSLFFWPIFRSEILRGPSTCDTVGDASDPYFLVASFIVVTFASLASRRRWTSQLLAIFKGAGLWVVVLFLVGLIAFYSGHVCM